VQAAWSPALVGFFGYGGGVGIGVGVGFGFGNIGWVPLAPYETFRPWWGAAYAGGFNRGVSITSVNVTTLYRNARVSNGISGVTAGDFTAGRFGSVQRVSSAQVQSAGLINGRVPLNPSVASRRFSDRAVTSVPRASSNTQFASRSAAAGAAHPAANAQPATGYHRFGEPGAASQNVRPPQAATGNGQRQGSLQRFGEPGSSQGGAKASPAPASPGGWRSFGAPGSSNGGRQPYSPPPARQNGSGGQQRTAPAPARSGGGHAKSGGRR
jgi:hypothetical protein